MTKSIWMTGTYEMLVQDFKDEAEMTITVFARPVDLADEASDRDAPILAQLDVSYAEVGLDDGARPPWQTAEAYRDLGKDGLAAFRTVGEHGLAPEDIEAEFGPHMGLRILLCLFQAADRDFRGVDMDAVPWRMPSMQAFPIMQRISDLMMILRTRLEM